MDCAKNIKICSKTVKCHLRHAPAVESLTSLTLQRLKGALNIFSKQGLNQIAKATQLVAFAIETLNNWIN